MSNVVPMPTLREYLFRLKSGVYKRVWAPSRQAAELVMKHEVPESYKPVLRKEYK